MTINKMPQTITTTSIYKEDNSTSRRFRIFSTTVMKKRKSSLQMSQKIIKTMKKKRSKDRNQPIYIEARITI